MKCFLCHENLLEQDSVKYSLLPSSVCKWSDTAKKFLYAPAAKFSVKVHKECARCRQGIPVLSSSVLLKSLSEEEQRAYKDICSNSIMLRQYLNKVHKVLAVQKNRCALCNRSITHDTAVLRRKDSTKPRVWWNAEAVCCKCCSLMNWINYQGENKNGLT